MIENFLKHIPQHDKETRSMIEQAFGISENLRGKVAEIQTNADISDLGKQRQIKALALGSFLEHMNQIKAGAAKMNTDAVNLRLALQPKQPDRADLYGQAERHKLLDRMQLLTPVEAFRLAMEDAEYTEAVLAHPRLSGLSSEQLDLVKQAYIERHYGPQLAGIAEREAIIGVLNDAIATATKQFVLATGLPERELDLNHRGYSDAVAKFFESIQQLDRGADDYDEKRLKVASDFREQVNDLEPSEA